ncbi:TrbI/VirB10 family protein [Erythrobacter sp. EC-HK427]|uniref:TrbI/VirB10 family protein n=1 Tax=Erythrobacter sp. EC-HK427 TaxID=2038396 RepID=UPI001255EA75|nr:TrbI/VirB10 family protein [Erythrobacter sp. EC-HK427]VVT06657.1 putative Type IV secretion system protein B10 [Erythrobacter sp. EC-HK427]
MKQSNQLPGESAASEGDPRDSASEESIDLASRTAYPAVANRNARADTIGLLAGIAFVALVGAGAWGVLSTSDGPASEDAQDQQVAQPNTAPNMAVAPGTTPTDGLPSANATAAAVTQPVGGATVQPVELTRAPDATVIAGPVAAPPNFNSPTLVFDGGTAPSSAAAVAAQAEAASAAQPNATIPGSGGANDFAARVGGVGGGTASASVDFNPATTVTQGTMIPAILETAINTDVPGYVRAVVSQDVRSHDGSRVLIPRSSRLVGQYQSGLQAGQRRAYVIWQRVIRPDGVSVALQSPGTAFDGTAGLEGEVDTHFFSRFGSAMLLSVIGGLTNIASGGASVVLGGGQSAASTALQQDGQRSPTIRVGMGEPIRVYTARDLDFGTAPAVRR